MMQSYLNIHSFIIVFCDRKEDMPSLSYFQTDYIYYYLVLSFMFDTGMFLLSFIDTDYVG